MSKRPKLSKGQYRYFASSFKIIAEGILLGSSAAVFLPEALQLQQSISIIRYISLLLVGLTSLLFGAILEKKGEQKHD